MSEFAKIDKFGRIVIPKKLRKLLGLETGTKLVIEKRADSLVLTPARMKKGDPLKRIARMDLPVDEWEVMEKEIEKGAAVD
jgi:AbrB family looped-hinge helix DNA binding protein